MPPRQYLEEVSCCQCMEETVHPKTHEHPSSAVRGFVWNVPKRPFAPHRGWKPRWLYPDCSCETIEELGEVRDAVLDGSNATEIDDDFLSRSRNAVHHDGRHADAS